jgi:hypothetical protein
MLPALDLVVLHKVVWPPYTKESLRYKLKSLHRDLGMIGYDKVTKHEGKQTHALGHVFDALYAHPPRTGHATRAPGQPPPRHATPAPIKATEALSHALCSTLHLLPSSSSQHSTPVSSRRATIVFKSRPLRPTHSSHLPPNPTRRSSSPKVHELPKLELYPIGTGESTSPE